MNNLEKTRKCIRLWRERFAENSDAKLRARIEVEAREAVQVMEFKGELYVSVNGVPLFGIDSFRASIADSVANGRKVYQMWKEEKLWRK